MPYTPVVEVDPVDFTDDLLEIGDTSAHVTKTNSRSNKIQTVFNQLSISIASINTLGAELSAAQLSDASEIAALNANFAAEQELNADEIALLKSRVDTAQSAIDAVEADLASGVDLVNLQANIDAANALLATLGPSPSIAQVAGLEDELDAINQNMGLAAFVESKALTPVCDPFIYDTRLMDSDGGDWRHRCHDSAFFSDTLDTATRGPRQDVPSIPILVAEASTLTIFDGETESRPMWKVYDFTGSVISSVKALNGSIYVGTDNGLTVINLITDAVDVYTTTSTPAIASNGVNDVDATVLDDAPICAVTGLPVSTTAVPTESGVSFIKDDGAVWSPNLGSFAQTDMAFNDDWTIMAVGRSADRVLKAYLGSGEFAFDCSGNNNYQYIYTLDIRNETFSLLLEDASSTTETPDFVHGGALSKLHINPSSPEKSMVAYITSTYNTGWMVGENVLTALCSTDTSDLVGSGELVTNGDFLSAAGWTFSGSAAIVSDELAFVGGASGEATGAVSIPAGKYVVAIDKTVTGSIGAANVYMAVRSGSTSLKTVVLGGAGGPEKLVSTIELTAAADNVLIYYNGSGSYEYKFDNISIRLADADRSVSGNGLVVHGTLSRTLISPDSDQVTYSGWGAWNNLSPKATGVFDFLETNTNPFTVCWWGSVSGAGWAPVVSKSQYDANKNWFVGCQNERISLGDTAVGSTQVPVNTRTFFALVSDGTTLFAYVDGKLDGTRAVISEDVAQSSVDMVIGGRHANNGTLPPTDSNKWSTLDHLHIFKTAASADQIAKKYNDEKKFITHPATLHGTSDDVQAMAHDDYTGLTHVCTSDGRSVMKGLVRIDNTTTDVDFIDAHDGLIVEGAV